ncbi:MAG: phage tail protein [Gammaproteobacteria bacterium]|nr:phage tail protein [Gammaproteobacteria bacterium]
MKTFRWSVNLQGASGEDKTEPKVVKFGEGYEQRQKQSIAPALEIWKVGKTGTKAEIDEIRKFLNEHGGVTAFLWQVEGDEPIKKWVNSAPTRTPLGAGLYQLTWEMREVLA